MYNSKYLEQWCRGMWEKIGWDANNETSFKELTAHAKALSRSFPDHKFRLVSYGLTGAPNVHLELPLKQA